MVKIHDRNTISPRNAVDRIFSGEEIKSTSHKMADFHQSDRTSFDIRLEDIKPRTVNNYRVSEIEELAGSIDRTGLWQPIVVKHNPESDKNDIGYMIVSGERRYTAGKYLRDKYINSGDSIRAEMFSTIPSLILEDSELDKEEQIYRDTNDYSRQLTNFERIVRLDPGSIDMGKHVWQVEYVRKLYGENRVADFEDGQIEVNGTTQEKCEYIVALLKEREPDLDVSVKTVRNYLTFLSKCSDNLKTAVLRGKVPLRDARVLCNLTPDEQSQAIGSYGSEAYDQHMQKAAILSAESVKKAAPEKTTKTMYESINKKLLKTCNSFKEDIDELNRTKSTLSKNQKAYLSKLESIVKAINELKNISIE